MTQACALLVGLVFALNVAAHGYREQLEDLSAPVGLVITNVDAISAAQAGLGADYIQIEHHQVTPRLNEADALARAGEKIVFVEVATRGVSHAAAPPHGPPRA